MSKVFIDKEKKSIRTYSHAFHIALNTLEDMDNLPHAFKVYINVDTRIHRNRILTKGLKETILRLYKKKTTISSIFTDYKNTNNLSTNFFWKSSIFRAIKEDVKNICEELSLAIHSFYLCNSTILFRHIQDTTSCEITAILYTNIKRLIK